MHTNSKIFFTDSWTSKIIKWAVKLAIVVAKSQKAGGPPLEHTFGIVVTVS